MINFLNLPSKMQLAANPVSKGELADRLFPETTYDTALPQDWLDDAVGQTGLDYGFLLSTVVWLYPPDQFGGIAAPLCRNTAYALRDIGFTFWLDGQTVDADMVNEDDISRDDGYNACQP